MLCLNCHTKLLNIEETHFFKHLIYDVCNRCDGLWLDKGELDKISYQTPGSVEFCSIDMHLANATKTSGNKTSQSLHCLRCSNQPLVKLHFMGESRILLDFCEKCNGMWVDGGELTKINQCIQWFDKKAKPSKFGRFLYHAHSSFFHRIDVNSSFEKEK